MATSDVDRIRELAIAFIQSARARDQAEADRQPVRDLEEEADVALEQLWAEVERALKLERLPGHGRRSDG